MTKVSADVSFLEVLSSFFSPSLEHDQLFFLVYERMELMNQSSMQPHLWTYRSRITLEHLAQTLQEKRMKERHPILYEFLQAVSVTLTCSLTRLLRLRLILG